MLAALRSRAVRPAPAGAPPRRWELGAVGLSVGVLTTTTTTNGPPMVLWLQRAAATPGELRDSAMAMSAILGVAGLGLVTPAGSDAAFTRLAGVVVAATGCASVVAGALALVR